MGTVRKGKIYLIPLPIAANTQEEVIPAYVKTIIQGLDYFLAENIRTARRYLRALDHPQPIAQLKFACLDKHTQSSQVGAYLQPILQGIDGGILTEAGCPGIADPGALAVQYAHQHQMEVIPLVGPSAILLALMAAGFNGQSFAFHGYLPIKKEERKKVIKKLENTAWRLKQTQIFIETPYRNQALLETLLNLCQPHTLLCIGKNITSKDGWVKTKLIQEWQKNKPKLHQRPTVFLLYGMRLLQN